MYWVVFFFLWMNILIPNQNKTFNWKDKKKNKNNQKFKWNGGIFQKAIHILFIWDFSDVIWLLFLFQSFLDSIAHTDDTGSWFRCLIAPPRIPDPNLHSNNYLHGIYQSIFASTYPPNHGSWIFNQILKSLKFKTIKKKKKLQLLEIISFLYHWPLFPGLDSCERDYITDRHISQNRIMGIC